MPTIVEFTVPPDTFPLGAIVQDFPTVEVELERVIPTTNAVIPYFWIWGEEVETIPAHFTGHPSVAAIEVVDVVPGGGLFRGEWQLTVDGILKAIRETTVTLLSGLGTQAEWEFQLRAEDQQRITHFQQYCRDHDIPITVTRLYALSELRSGEQYHITPSQEEALITAFEAGYFSQPRAATLEEIAPKLEITRQSLAERLRRGHRNLIANTLMHGID